MKNIFSQITFNFQRIAYKNTAKLNIKIFFANQTYASISDIYIFFRYRRPICKSNAIRLVHQTIKKTPGQFRRKAKTPAPSCKATKKNESGDRDGEKQRQTIFSTVMSGFARSRSIYPSSLACPLARMTIVARCTTPSEVRWVSTS